VNVLLIKLEDNFIVTCSCGLFFITMSVKRRGKHSLFNRKISILVQVDGNKETNVSLAARLVIPLSELNTIVKNR
jgi:archaellum component FlaG (FlaF/FlaG flagellin family)